MLGRVRRLLDVMLGEGRLGEADPSDLFAITTGHVTLESNGYASLDRAGLCFNRVDAVDFEAAVEELSDLLAVSASEVTEQYEVVDDDYGYAWVLLDDPVFDDLVTSIHAASDTLIERGYGEYLLCAVFAFERNREVYLVYNFKRGAWYPFVPVTDGRRDEDLEATVEELLDDELDIESDDSRRYPLWDIPF